MIKIYYAMINITDFLATHETDEATAASLYNVLDILCNIYAKEGNEEPAAVLSAIADANDAGGAASWPELVKEFKTLHDAGERI